MLGLFLIVFVVIRGCFYGSRFCGRNKYTAVWGFDPVLGRERGFNARGLVGKYYMWTVLDSSMHICNAVSNYYGLAHVGALLRSSSASQLLCRQCQSPGHLLFSDGTIVVVLS